MLTLRGLLANRRGVAAFEFIVVAPFLLFVLLLPIADVGVAALRYMQARQAMRDLGALVQYNPPPDLTTFSAETWKTLPKTIGTTFTVTIGATFPASENQTHTTKHTQHTVVLGVFGPACTSDDLINPSKPKYVWMGARVTLNPIVLNITGGTLDYTERLQWPLPL